MADSDTEFDYAVPVRRSIVATLPARLGMPLVMTPADLPSLPDKLGAAGEFAFALTFAPALVDAVADHGYFPMALDIGVPVFAPKVHKERCALALQKHLHIRKCWRKAAGKYTLTINRCMERVMDFCVRDHGENWLFPKLRRAFLHMQHHPDKYKITLLSCEFWQGSRLVACELGYAQGSVYTSLTGAYDRTFPGAGLAQLAAFGSLLKRVGFEVWDFGMSMGYKVDLGGRTWKRQVWLLMHSKYKTVPAEGDTPVRRMLALVGDREWNGRAVVDGRFEGPEAGAAASPTAPPSPAAPAVGGAGSDSAPSTAPTAVSKKQQKRAAKLQRIAAAKASKSAGAGDPPPPPST